MVSAPPAQHLHASDDTRVITQSDVFVLAICSYCAPYTGATALPFQQAVQTLPLLKEYLHQSRMKIVQLALLTTLISRHSFGAHTPQFHHPHQTGQLSFTL